MLAFTSEIFWLLFHNFLSLVMAFLFHLKPLSPEPSTPRDIPCMVFLLLLSHYCCGCIWPQGAGWVALLRLSTLAYILVDGVCPWLAGTALGILMCGAGPSAELAAFLQVCWCVSLASWNGRYFEGVLGRAVLRGV